MLGHETGGERIGVAIDDVVDRTLAIERDVEPLVARDLDIAHLLEQRLEVPRHRMRELDKLETIGSGRVGGADYRRRRIMRKGSHRLHSFAASSTLLAVTLGESGRNVFANHVDKPAICAQIMHLSTTL